MRIAVASFSHETCTFCPEPTTIARLEPYVLRGQEVFDRTRGIPTYINGFMEVAQAETDVDLIPIILAGPSPGGFTTWFETEAFDKYADEIVAGIKAALPLDGVLLALHGAMAVTNVPKPEAELARRVRAVVGDIPIMVTLDLHANEDHELTEATDAVFVIKTYPHVDSQETGIAAAQCLVDTIRGKVKPVQALRRPGIVSASIFQASDFYPMKDIYARCEKWEEDPRVIRVNVAPGYAYADVPDIGMSVIAVTNDAPELAEDIAQDISDFAWTLKEALNRPLPNTKDGVAQVIKLVGEGKGPVLIADGADRTGDSTHVLRELLAQGAKSFGIPGIADPQAAKLLEETAKVGDTVTVTIGGWASEHSGEPIEVTGKIDFMGRPSYTLIGPMRKGMTVQDGFVVALNLGNNNHVVVSERMRGANDSSAFTAVGIDYTSLDIIILKDRVHHRAYWDDIVNIDFPIDAPGIGVVNLLDLKFENAPDDAYPIGTRWRKDS